MSCGNGFTLIELLIVVAIIGILAAIAVPNFMNAQTRANIARVQADFNSLATSLESYRLDCNHYPVDSNNTLPIGFSMLTTPVSYMNIIPVDPFFMKAQSELAGLGQSAPYYEMGSDTPWDNSGSEKYAGTWALTSIGPDALDSTNSQAGWPWVTRWWDFDPSNGLHSFGDIFAMGGNYSEGTWTRNGKPNRPN